MSKEDAVRRQVAAALRRQLSQDGRESRQIIDEKSVQAIPEGGTLSVPAGALVTPLAQSEALARRVKLVTAGETEFDGDGQTIAIGADHGGYAMKELLKAALQADYTLVDCGTNGPESVDYPDFAQAVAAMVGGGRAWRGIIIDGAGIGSCMVANKVPGVRAAMCYDQATAANSREHNNANVLTLGAGLIGNNLAQQIVTTWLATDFGGGRHARRVEKIMQIERRYRG